MTTTTETGARPMTTTDDTTTDIGSQRAEEFAENHPTLVKVGRVGWVAKGLVYALTGLLAVLVAIDPFGRQANAEASQSGAIATIANRPAGSVLMIVLAAGLATYAVWRLASLILPADNDIDAWLTRLGYAVSAAAYLSLAWTAVSFARRPGSKDGSEDAQVERLTREFMQHSGGRTLVVIAGVVLLAIGAFYVRNAVTAGFDSQLQRGGVGPVSHDLLVILGRIGWVGRAAMVGLIGYFLIQAALTFDPDDAQGLDGSLRETADSALGVAVVLVVAVGLVVYGVFCMLSAPRRELVAADR